MKRRSSTVGSTRSDHNYRLVLPFQSTRHQKTAHISTLPEFEHAEPFSRERWPSLAAFCPNILLGYGFDLQRLAAKVGSGEWTLNSVDRAIFALTDCGSIPVSDQLREQLWKVFGVPVYELIVAPGCRLLAAECELHHGWHLEESTRAYVSKGQLVYDIPGMAGVHSGFTGEIDAEPCDCGRPTTRLQKLAPYPPANYRPRFAATA